MSARPVYAVLFLTIVVFIAFLNAPKYDTDERSDFAGLSTVGGDEEFVYTFHGYGIRAAIQYFPLLTRSEFEGLFVGNLAIGVARDILYIGAFLTILQLPLLASPLPIPLVIRRTAAVACVIAALVSAAEAVSRTGGVFRGHQIETARVGAYLEPIVFLLASATLCLRIRNKA